LCLDCLWRGGASATLGSGGFSSPTLTGSTVSWASDHVTRTTTSTYSDGTSSSTVATVAGTAGTPSYSGNQQTIVTTYGDGHTATATNSSTSAPVTWASDHVTRTTTYTFANGGTNPVVDTVAATPSTPALTAAVYPSDWTTVGTVLNPSVSALTNTYGDGTVTTLESGTSLLPFNQSTLLARSITDPSAIVRSSTTDYNLIWGIPDKNGPSFASLFPGATAILPITTLMGRNITSWSSLSVGPTFNQPSADVLSAWNSGWTGLGKNIMLIDSYDGIAACNDFGPGTGITCHGMHTMLIAGLVAVNAGLIGLDSSLAYVAKNGVSGVSLSSAVNANVINMSIGSTPCNNGCGGAPSDSTFATLTANALAYNTGLVTLLNSTSNANNVSNMASAVLVKSAGNAYQDAKYDATTVALIGNATTAARLLVVGALDKNGTTASKANADTFIGTSNYYSNYAGSNTAISDRFVFAYGRDPYPESSVAFNSTVSSVGQGTSYAAPVVAGYAAIVMQKFPNLDATKTSSIILDTARYDTLSCYPSCSPSVWGKGEASLSRALAPVGQLR
jgi:hypothetical protein